MQKVIDTIYESEEAIILKKIVGSIVVHFGLCEQLGSVLVDRVTSTQSGRVIFENYSNAGKRIKEYRKVLDKKKGRIKCLGFQEVESWMDDLDYLKDSRNHVVHSAWVPFIGLDEFERDIIIKIPQGKKLLQRERMSKIELEKINHEIVKLHVKGWEIFHKIIPFK